jgi:NAD(P)H dehydrogenase (quinone)
MAELATEVSQHTGRALPYRDLPVKEYEAALIAAGLPPPLAAMFSEVDVGIACGELEVTPRDLGRLTGRPTQSLADAIAAALPR